MKFRNFIIKINFLLTKFDSLVFALPLASASLIITTNYTVGVAFVPNELIRYTSYIQEFLFFIAIVGLGKIYLKKFSALIKVFLTIPILFYLISFFISILLYGVTSHLASCLLYFIVLGAPFYLVGAIVAKYGKEKELLEGLNKWSLFVLPLVIHYTVMEFANIQPVGTLGGHLGVYTYLSIAYMLLPFMLSWFLTLLGREESNCSNRRIVINVLMISIFWIPILYTGTRGTILSGLFFAICISLYSILTRHKERVNVVLATFFVFIIFIVGVFVPPLNMKRLSRLSSLQHLFSNFHSVQNKIEEHKLPPTDWNIPNTSEVNSNDDGDITNEPNNIINGLNEETKNHNSNDGFLECELAAINSSNSRVIIYSTAIEEIKDNPLFGLGPLGFYYKYNSYYSHNIFLELIVECGIAGLIAVAYLIVKFFKLATMSRKNHNILLVFLLLLGHVIYYMISGTIWKNPTLLFFLGYAFFSTQETVTKE